MSKNKRKPRARGMSRSSLILALVLATAGVVLLIWPDAAPEVAVNVVGGALIVMGVGVGIVWLLGRASAPGYTNLIKGVLAIAAGIALMIAQDAVLQMLPVLIGAAIVVLGFVNLYMCFRLKKWGLNRWGFALGAAVAGILLGVLIAALRLAGKDLSVVLLGVVLLASGLIHLWISSLYAKLEKARRRAIEEAMDGKDEEEEEEE